MYTGNTHNLLKKCGRDGEKEMRHWLEDPGERISQGPERSVG